MEKNGKIYVAGHRGLVGSAIVRKLKEREFSNLVLKSHRELDLTDQVRTREFFAQEKPEYVFLAAAYVGGIQANAARPADFFLINSMIQNNVIGSAHAHGARKLLFLGSSCIYPRDCPQPIKEEYLLTGPLEQTNEAYALAKISGLKMCQYYNKQYGTNFISCMPTNLYGPYDNFDLENSHVLPALIRKFHEAKQLGVPAVEIWGTGSPLREFLHVDDMADACVFLMENYNGQEHVNIGTGKELTIKELAVLIKDIAGYAGDLAFNTDKPDGTPRKLLDVSRLDGLGWKHRIDLREGIESTYKWYVENRV